MLQCPYCKNLQSKQGLIVREQLTHVLVFPVHYLGWTHYNETHQCRNISVILCISCYKCLIWILFYAGFSEEVLWNHQLPYLFVVNQGGWCWQPQKLQRRKRQKKVKIKKKGPRRRQQRRLFLNDVKVVWLRSSKEVGFFLIFNPFLINILMLIPK